MNDDSRLDCSDVYPTTVHELWKTAWAMAGRSLFYMQDIYPDVYANSEHQL